MKLLIDNFSAITGWSASGGASIHGLNTIKEFIAGDLSASIILEFSGTNSYCEKTLTTPVDVTSYNNLTFHIWSQNNGKAAYNSTDDFVYKIELGTSKTYYLPSNEILDDVTLDISDLTSIEKIKITILNAITDYLVISYCVISKDEMPYDIFIGVQEKLDAYIAANLATTFLVGAITNASINDDSITFVTDPCYATRYSKIMITDGVNTEYHHIIRKDARTFYFSSYYDGKKLIHNYTAANVYLCFAVEFGYHPQIVLPTCSIWGLSPENTPIETDVQTDLDTWKITGTVNETQTGQWFKYLLMFDCESDNLELLLALSNAVQKVIGRHYVWVNGKKCSLEYSGAPTVIDPTDVVNNIPKIQYNATVTIKEDIWDKTRIYQWTSTTNTYDIIVTGDQ